MFAKIGLGILSLGGLSTGIIGLSNPEWLGIDIWTHWKPLGLESSFKASEYEDKFGSKNKNYLVGLSEENKDWWEESYKRWESDYKNEEFTLESRLGKGFKDKLDGAFTETPSNPGDGKRYLNQLCYEIYKTDNEDIKDLLDEAIAIREGSDKDSFYREWNVWKYCSPAWAAPKIVGHHTSEVVDYYNKIGNFESDVLLATQPKQNDRLWRIKNDEFFGLGVFKTETPKEAPQDEFFASLFNGSNKGRYALKDKCAEAYKLAKSNSPSAAQSKAKDVVKYCSIRTTKLSWQ